MAIVHHVPAAGTRPMPTSASTDDPGPDAEARQPDRVARAQARLDEAIALLPLLNDPRMLEVPSDEEFQADYRVEQAIRDAARQERQRAGLREVARTRREREARDELAAMDLDDLRDDRLARRQQQRVTDPRRHLIDLYRESRLAAKLTSAMIIGGIAWTSVTVHNNLVGAEFPSWAGGAGLGVILVWLLAFIVEPLASIPLVLVMRAQLKSSAHGDTKALRSAGVLLLEAIALMLSLALNSFPYLPVLGTWQGPGQLVSHSLAPIMILVAVITHEVLARTYARRMTDAAEECEWSEGTRLGGVDTRGVLVTMAKIERLMLDGELEPAEDGYPAMNQLVRTKRLRASKAKLSAARDGLVMLSRARNPIGVDPVTRAHASQGGDDELEQTAEIDRVPA